MQRLRELIRTGQVHRLEEEAQAGREPLPPNDYMIELTDGILVEDEGAATDALNLQWNVAVGGGEFAGRRIFQNLRFQGGGVPFTFNALKLLGIDVEPLYASAQLSPLPDDPRWPGQKRYRPTLPLGIVVLAKVGHWTGQDGRTRHQIERLLRVVRPAPDLNGLALGPPARPAGPVVGAGTGEDDEDIPF